jgi:hypothetical protein
MSSSSTDFDLVEAFGHNPFQGKHQARSFVFRSRCSHSPKLRASEGKFLYCDSCRRP